MNIDEIARQSLLFDFYGELLSKRQKQVLELYTEENLSLQEIAEQFGISRQGVHDALRSGRKALEGYETKLGLVERFLQTEAVIEQIDGRISDMIGSLTEGRSGKDLIRELEQVREIIDHLGE